MHAIATVYKGIRFRSRLEAKWAAFFDLLGWRWAYEPLDLRGYIPDFHLHFKNPLLVEVKPALAVKHMEEFTPKLLRSGWDGDFLMVGTQLFESSAFERLPSFGGYYPPILGLHWGEEIKLKQKFDGGIGGITVERDWAKAALFRCIKCSRPTVVRRAVSYRCSVCGHHDPLGEDVELLGSADHLWAEACNVVQWRGQSK
jgi:hypothetical protein